MMDKNIWKHWVLEYRECLLYEDCDAFLFTTMKKLGFPGGSAGKESTCSAGDLGLIPGLGRSLKKGMATPSNSGLENPNGITKSQTWLSDFHFTSWIN